MSLRILQSRFVIIKMSNILLCRIAYFFVSKSKKQMSYDLLCIFAVTSNIMFLFDTQNVLGQNVFYFYAKRTCSFAFSFFSSIQCQEQNAINLLKLNVQFPFSIGILVMSKTVASSCLLLPHYLIGLTWSRTKTKTHRFNN